MRGEKDESSLIYFFFVARPRFDGKQNNKGEKRKETLFFGAFWQHIHTYTDSDVLSTNLMGKFTMESH